MADRRDVNEYTHNENTRKENLVLMKIFLNALPPFIVGEIKDFRKHYSPIIKNHDFMAVEEMDPALRINERLEELTQLITRYSELPPKLFAPYIRDYIVTNKLDAPSSNYTIKKTKNSVSIEFFRTPKTNDWKQAQSKVEGFFDSLPPVQREKIDPRLLETLDKKMVSSNYKSTYDAIDKIFGEDNLFLDKKRTKAINQYKHRLAKLKDKLQTL